VLSPTRELAMQIRDAAITLTQSTTLGVQCVVGGTNVTSEANKLKRERCDILIATPGRLIDHLGNASLNLPSRLYQIRTFVLDEADRMLDQGMLALSCSKGKDRHRT
jgi:ATP-dependent RNA helicase MSS116